MTSQDLKNSILQYAIQGKLVPQNPTHEPASELLKRIKAEKEQLILNKKIKKEKPLQAIAEDEIPFEIPESWEWVRLGDAFNLVMGQSPDGKSVSNSTKGVEFHQGKVFFSKKYILESNQTTNEPSKIAEANSVLLCVRAPVGIVNITDRKLCIGRGLCAIKPLAEMSVEFVFYMLETYKHIFVKQATGTTFVAITGEVVKNQLIPLPPLAEQQLIVEKIEELMPMVEEYGKAELELRQLNKAFPEQIKKSVLQYAVQGKLVSQNPQDESANILLDKIKAEKQQLIKDKVIKASKPLAPITEEEIPFEIPDSWVWVRLGDAFSVVMGQSPDGKSVSNSTKGVEFHQGKVFFSKKYILESNQTTNAPSKIAEANSVLLCVRAPVGIVNITNRELCIGRGLCAIKPLAEMSVEFVFYMLETYKHIFVKQATGTTFVAITGEVVKNQLIPLPPLSEQKRIVEKVEEMLGICEKLKGSSLKILKEHITVVR